MNELSLKSKCAAAHNLLPFMVPSPTEISSPEVSGARGLPDGDYFWIWNVDKRGERRKGVLKYSALVSEIGIPLWLYLNGARSQLHLHTNPVLLDGPVGAPVVTMFWLAVISG